jgi:hypothetical protein
MSRLWFRKTGVPKEKYASTPLAKRLSASRAVPEYECRITAGNAESSLE